VRLISPSLYGGGFSIRSDKSNSPCRPGKHSLVRLPQTADTFQDAAAPLTELACTGMRPPALLEILTLVNHAHPSLFQRAPPRSDPRFFTRTETDTSPSPDPLPLNFSLGHGHLDGQKAPSALGAVHVFPVDQGPSCEKQMISPWSFLSEEFPLFRNYCNSCAQ